MVEFSAARLIFALGLLAVLVAAATALVLAWVRAQSDAARRRMLASLNLLAEQMDTGSASGVLSKLTEALPNALPVSAVELYICDRASRQVAKVPSPQPPRWQALAMSAAERGSIVREARAMAIPASGCVFVVERERGAFSQDESAALAHVANQAAAALDRDAGERLRDRLVRVDQAPGGEPDSAVPIEIRGLLAGLIRYRERDWKRLGIHAGSHLEGPPLWASVRAGSLERRVLELFSELEQQGVREIRVAASRTDAGILVEAGDASWTLPEAAVPAASSAAALTLLVAEPQAALRARMVDDLSAHGHRVVPVADIDQAVDLARRMRFDAIVAARSLAGGERLAGLAPRIVTVDDWLPAAVLGAIAGAAS